MVLSTSRSRISFLKRQLQTILQGNKSSLSYIEETKLLSNQLAAADKTVKEQDLITYLLSGLKPHFMFFVTTYTFTTRDQDLPIDDFQAELLNFETFMEAPPSFVPTKTNLAFVATDPKVGSLKKPIGSGFSHQVRSPNRPQYHVGSSSNSPNAAEIGDKRPVCQICEKKGHTTLDFITYLISHTKVDYHHRISLLWLLKATTLMLNKCGMLIVGPTPTLPITQQISPPHSPMKEETLSRLDMAQVW